MAKATKTASPATPTRDLADGESTEVWGSGAKPYVIKNTGGVYACTCPAWRNQSTGSIRTCKHIKALRGEAAESARLSGIATSGSGSGSVDVITLGSGAPATVPEPASHTSTSATPPPVLLAEAWDNEQDLRGMWISEKLDGVRAYWNGADFVSRQGNIYHAPDWFKVGLPSFPLDGELWVGRGMFQECVSIVRRQDKSDHWRKVRYVVFDAPDLPETAPGVEQGPMRGTSPFEARLGKIIAHAAQANGSAWGPSSVAAAAEFASTLSYLGPIMVSDHARMLPQRMCRTMDELRTQLADVIAGGGEGLMARKFGSLYVAGRSDTLVKIKMFHDAEAKVIGHSPGKGRHKGRLGALEVEAIGTSPAVPPPGMTPPTVAQEAGEDVRSGTGTGKKSQVLQPGTRFSVGTGLSDADRGKPPPLGTVITFRYQELTDAGVPRFPSFLRVRPEGS